MDVERAVPVAIALLSLMVPGISGLQRFPIEANPPPSATDSKAGATRISSCAYPYVVKVGKRTTGVGGCAGNLGYGLEPDQSPQTVNVPRGRRFTIEDEHDEGGPALVPVLLPQGSAVKLVGRTAFSGIYDARHLGTASMMASGDTACGWTEPNTQTCTAARITVTKR